MPLLIEIVPIKRSLVPINDTIVNFINLLSYMVYILRIYVFTYVRKIRDIGINHAKYLK